MGKKQTRKDFLTNTSKYAVGAVAGVAGLNALAGGKILANSTNYDWPWPYQELDPEAIRIRAHHLKLDGFECCAGLFGAFIEALNAAIGAPYDAMPYEVMLYGRGGGAAWGSLCGCVNAASAVISLVVSKADSGALIKEVYGWAASTLLPTDQANQVALDNNYTNGTFNGTALDQSISGSVLCHASVSNWCSASGHGIGDPERKERCARITGDLAAKTAEVLNAYFAQTFVAEFATPAYAAECLTCHGSDLFYNARTQESCEPCHGDPHANTTAVETRTGTPTNFNISQNYPNPFNPSTKIQFSVPTTDRVQLDVYDIQGQLVSSLINSEVMDAGNYTVSWDGKNGAGSRVSSGIYFARLTSSNFMKTIKMNLMK